MGMITSLREQLDDAIEDINHDIDRLVGIRERLKASRLALDPAGKASVHPSRRRYMPLAERAS